MNIEETVRHLPSRVPECEDVLLLRSDGTDVSIGDRHAPSVAGVARDLVAHARHVTLCPREEHRPFDDAPLEMIVLSDERTVLIRELKRSGGPMVAAVCSRSANLGMLLGVLRREIAAIEDAL